jgi:GntR family transcriptional regulator
MIIVIDLESSVTLEEQIRSGIRELIAAGKLKEGETLPSVRQLAGDLSVHWNTVARAYKRLQEEGLLVVGHGRGVFVKSGRSTAKLEPQVRTRLTGKLREVFVDARLLGMSVADIRALALEELKHWSNQEDRS